MTYTRAALRLFQELGDRQMVDELWKRWRSRPASPGAPERAAHLLGAAAGLRDAIGTPVADASRADYERYQAEARAQLPDAAWAAAWEQGRRTPVAQLATSLEE